jgi:hypothetical protein
MKKKLLLLITLLATGVFAQVVEECELKHSTPIFNSTTPYGWLDQYTPLPPSFPMFYENMGFSCDNKAIILTTDGQEINAAYYTETKEDDNEIRYRWALATQGLLNSFEAKNLNNPEDITDDSLVLFKVHAINDLGSLNNIIKLRLHKFKDGKLGKNEWKISLQWFDRNSNEKTHQDLYFKESDEYVEFEFFWKKQESLNSQGSDVVYSINNFGMLISRGFNATPQVFISPYDYEGHYSHPNGTFYLGYINANNNPALNEDEIGLISPIKYSR